MANDLDKPFAILMDATRRAMSEIARCRGPKSHKDTLAFVYEHLRQERERAWRIHAEAKEAPRD